MLSSTMPVSVKFNFIEHAQKTELVTLQTWCETDLKLNTKCCKCRINSWADWAHLSGALKSDKGVASQRK